MKRILSWDAYNQTFDTIKIIDVRYLVWKVTCYHHCPRNNDSNDLGQDIYEDAYFGMDMSPAHRDAPIPLRSNWIFNS